MRFWWPRKEKETQNRSAVRKNSFERPTYNVLHFQSEKNEAQARIKSIKKSIDNDSYLLLDFILYILDVPELPTHDQRFSLLSLLQGSKGKEITNIINFLYQLQKVEQKKSLKESFEKLYIPEENIHDPAAKTKAALGNHAIALLRSCATWMHKHPSDKDYISAEQANGLLQTLLRIYETHAYGKAEPGTETENTALPPSP